MTTGATEALLNAAAVSLKTAGMATIVALVLGGGLAWILSGRNGRWTLLVEFMVSLPLVLPPAMLGFYLLLALGRSGPVGRVLYWLLDTEIIFTPAAAMLAAAIVALPIMYKTIKLLFDQVNPDVMDAAMLDGASSWQLLLFVRLPLAWSGILAGIMLSFLRALGEFGATLIVAGNIPGRTQTLSLALWSSVLSGDENTAHVLAAVLAGLAIPTLYAIRLLERRHSPEPKAS